MLIERRNAFAQQWLRELASGRVAVNREASSHSRGKPRMMRPLHQLLHELDVHR